MKLCRAVGLTLAFAACHLCLAGEPPTLDEVVAELTGKAPMSRRTKDNLRATHSTVLGMLMPKLAGDDLNAREQAQETWKAICWHAARPGADAERTANAQAMVARLKPDTPRPALLFLLRQLETAGREESVDTLASLLEADDALVRERARITLQRNSSSDAADVLRRALRKATDPAWKVALASALGARGDKGALRDLMALATSRDEAIRLAGAEALASIGDGAAEQAIARATTIDGSDRTWHATCRAYLWLADQICAQGEKRQALGMYRKFLKASGHLRCAAVIGLGRAGGADEIPAIFEALEDRDPEVRGAARAALELLPVEAVRQAVAQRARTAEPAMLVQLLAILSARGGAAELPTFVGAASHPSEDVRVAAIEGMGRLGGADAVPVLLAALTKASGREREAVRSAIGSIQGGGATRAIVAAMADADPALRVELIQLLADRRATRATPTLLNLAADKDARVRDAALKALGVLADATALPTLVKRLVTAGDEAGRKAAEKAVVAVCNRIEDETERAQPVVAALATAKDQAARVALVDVLGRIGGGEALDALRAASKDPDEKVQDAAIRAMAEWRNARVAADLLRVAAEGKTLVHRVLALRGYVRVLGLPSDRPASETLKMYGDALGVAERPDEKRLVISGIASVPDAAALKMVEPFLADATLGSEAAIATANIAAAIIGTDREAAKAALEKLLATSQDTQARKLATDTLAQLDKLADYVTAWQVSGPYTKPGCDGPRYHNEKFPPETDPAKAAWATMPPGGNEPKLPYLMDLYKRFEKENCVAYLRTNIWSPADQEVQMEFGSDDGAKVWLNGKLVLNVNQPRSFKEAENKGKVQLKQGWNPLLVKVWNGGKWWSAALRFRAADGSRVEGLRASIEPD